MSCTSLQPVGENINRVHLDENNIQKLYGKYSDSHTGKSGLSLSHLLLREKTLSTEDTIRDIISIDNITDKSISFSLIRDGEVIKELKLKGEIENDYFVFKPRRHFPILWFVLNGYSVSKSRVGILKDGSLIFDIHSSGMVFFIFFPLGGADNGFYDMEFKKIN